MGGKLLVAITLAVVVEKVLAVVEETRELTGEKNLLGTANLVPEPGE